MLLTIIYHVSKTITPRHFPDLLSTDPCLRPSVLDMPCLSHLLSQRSVLLWLHVKILAASTWSPTATYLLRLLNWTWTRKPIPELLHSPTRGIGTHLTSYRPIAWLYVRRRGHLRLENPYPSEGYGRHWQIHACPQIWLLGRLYVCTRKSSRLYRRT